MSYRNAQVPTTMRDDTDARPLYFQWHHGTDARGDALADGGWECEVSKYPGLMLPLPKGSVKHGEKTILAWHASVLSVAVLAQETRWFSGPSAAAVEVSGYVEGAWSRMRLLVWVAEIEKPAILTLRASAAAAFGRGLKAFRNGPLALARRDVPGLPLGAFWLDVSAGPRERRGEGSNAAWVTLPVIAMPDEDADDALVRDWLDQRYVGDDLLAVFAELPELAQFKQRVAQQPAAGRVDPDYDDAEQYGAPDASNAVMDAFYREAHALGLSAQQIVDLLSRAGQDPAIALDLLTSQPRQAAQPAMVEPPPDDDGFEAMHSASEEPEVKAALAQAAQASHFPLPPRTVPSTAAAPTNGAGLGNAPAPTNGAGYAAEHALPAAAHEQRRPPAPPALPAPDAEILGRVRGIERSDPFKSMTGFAVKETWGMWQTLAMQTLVKLGHGGRDNGLHAFRLVTARLAGVDIADMTGNWQASQRSVKAWLHWLSVKDANGNPVRPTQVSAKSAKEMDVIFQAAEAELAEVEAPAF